MSGESYRLSTSQLLRTSFALEPQAAKMIQELKEAHSANSVTDYIKGLVAIDWLQTKKTHLAVTQVPLWAIVTYNLEVSQGKVQLPSVPREPTADVAQIRINDLARELDVKASTIVDLLPGLGVREKKTHSSLIPVAIAEKVREGLTAKIKQPHQG
jgi:hypothetical protein